MSFGRTDDEGFTPNNRLRKTNFGLGGAATLENGIRINGTLNYANTDYTTPPIAASLGSGSVSSYTSSIFGDVMYTPRSVDLMGLPYITLMVDLSTIDQVMIFRTQDGLPKMHLMPN